MLDFFKQKQTDVPEGKPKKDKLFIVAIILLAVFVIISLVTGVSSGTFREMGLGFRFQVSDGAALAVLLIAYIIYRIRKGRNNGG